MYAPMFMFYFLLVAVMAAAHPEDAFWSFLFVIVILLVRK